jgi:bifunctional DNA-binding transcriptional regulator/antitoxin component of YhaV-PrlF toxin-antitoxin module
MNDRSFLPLGPYYMTVDGKFRIAIPKELRELYGFSIDSTVFIGLGDDEVLYLSPQASVLGSLYQQGKVKISDAPRVDNEWRILIHQIMRDNLKSTDAITIFGIYIRGNPAHIELHVGKLEKYPEK